MPHGHMLFYKHVYMVIFNLHLRSDSTQTHKSKAQSDLNLQPLINEKPRTVANNIAIQSV